MPEDKKKSGKKVLEERNRAFEAKYQQDEEIRFKARIRANKLAGQWMAGLLGLSGEQADDYVKAMIDLGFSDAPGDKLLAKVAADLESHGKPMEAHKLKTEILRLSLIAEEQIMTEILGDNV
ncbi:MAG: DUF1476 domain-containing protein [Alphaproteobacteria bacterium]|nr:DUF1476 domain-containing protein [Alphaproteobacteria bacterium]